ncbi:MAG: D-tyrosyl-tRNA(Tyr) deacylase [Limisphaerales bacterium]
MRALIQRVSEASVTIEGTVRSSIGQGFLILLGIEQEDDGSDMDWLVNKIVQMRIFSDEEGHMNVSLKDVDGELLVVSQFTLHASTKKGNRPSFIKAARPEQAIPLYEGFIKAISEALGKAVGTGEFGASMQVALINDGPVTIWIDSKNRD